MVLLFHYRVPTSTIFLLRVALSRARGACEHTDRQCLTFLCMQCGGIAAGAASVVGAGGCPPDTQASGAEAIATPCALPLTVLFPGPFCF